jgi:hypothetical protein
MNVRERVIVRGSKENEKRIKSGGPSRRIELKHTTKTIRIRKKSFFFVIVEC